MPNARKSLLGKTFGHQRVVAYAGQNKPGGNSKWLCKCKCGNQTEVYYQHLVTGRTKSCSCMKGRWPKTEKEKL